VAQHTKQAWVSSHAILHTDHTAPWWGKTGTSPSLTDEWRKTQASPRKKILRTPEENIQNWGEYENGTRSAFQLLCAFSQLYGPV